jgi:hypothetical protein
MKLNSNSAAAKKMMQFANEYEPKVQLLWSDIVKKIKTANRWTKVAVALILLWRVYVLLMPRVSRALRSDATRARAAGQQWAISDAPHSCNPPSDAAAPTPAKPTALCPTLRAQFDCCE